MLSFDSLNHEDNQSSNRWNDELICKHQSWAFQQLWSRFAKSKKKLYQIIISRKSFYLLIHDEMRNHPDKQKCPCDGLSEKVAQIRAFLPARSSSRIGRILAICTFHLGYFDANPANYLHHRANSEDDDAKRVLRLFFRPFLIILSHANQLKI